MLNKRNFLIVMLALLVFYISVGSIYLHLDRGVFLTIHMIIEFASVIISMLVCIFCWYDYRYQQQQKLLILAFTFCIMGMLDFVHTLSYLGMPEFITENSANKASTYWVLARLVQGSGIFLAVCLQDRKLRLPRAAAWFFLVMMVVMVGIGAVALYLPYLPSMYDPVAQSQTLPKIFIECVVIGLYILSIFKLVSINSTDKRDVWLAYALAVGVFSELAFVTYVHVYDSYNLLGHIFKIISSGLVLKGLFDEAIGKLYRTNEELAAQRHALKEANRRLRKADQLKDEFMANTNHELRSPLTAIIAFTELLQDKQTGSLNPLQIDYISEIKDSSNELLNRVNEIRDLSKIKAGKMVLRPEKVDLNNLVLGMVRRVQPQFESKGVALEVSCPSDITVMGDAERIAQIISNLLSNALKFTSSGGSVRVGGGKDSAGKSARVIVEDSGIGIDPSEHDAVFQMFYQVDGTSSRSYSGTGIGLSLVKKLVELHGGTIKLESQLNQGSRFILSLPLYNSAGCTEVDYGTQNSCC